MAKVGTCGWQRFPERGDKIKLYAKHFSFVEVNSTFYRLPRESTARRWLEKAREVNERFEFTVKAPKEITHNRKFGEESIEVWEAFLPIVEALEGKLVLFQTPHKGFQPTEENIERARAFFKSIERRKLNIAWEVRWKEEWSRDIVEKLFSELHIIHAVDPLRQEPFREQPFNYYRLHGFGKRMMYNYRFSEEELSRVAKMVKEDDYVFFNNIYMYEDAERFLKLQAERL